MGVLAECCCECGEGRGCEVWAEGMRPGPKDCGVVRRLEEGKEEEERELVGSREWESAVEAGWNHLYLVLVLMFYETSALLRLASLFRVRLLLVYSRALKLHASIPWELFPGDCGVWAFCSWKGEQNGAPNIM